MSFKVKMCEDLQGLAIKAPDKYVCEACVTTGDNWVHLRKCQSCGITLCCDSSPNQHARKHWETQGHGVILSAEPGEKWAYCFAHDSFNPTAY